MCLNDLVQTRSSWMIDHRNMDYSVFFSEFMYIQISRAMTDLRDPVNADQLLFAFVVVLLILVVIQVCSFPNKSDPERMKNWHTERGYWIPQGWLKPRLWYTAPGSYGNYYGEELLTCMDGCAGRMDRQDCLKYCKRMYPYLMGFHSSPHHGITAIKPGQSGNPELDVGKKDYQAA